MMSSIEQTPILSANLWYQLLLYQVEAAARYAGMFPPSHWVFQTRQARCGALLHVEKHETQSDMCTPATATCKLANTCT
jgi:hypothetical protein